MYAFLRKLDEVAGTGQSAGFALLLERLAFVFLVLMILSAPHSIAATQISWLSGTIFWTARLFIKPRPKFIFTFLAVPLNALFVWSVITSITSYAPDISFGRLRSTTLFLIFFFVINNLRNLKAVRFLFAALILSTMVGVIWMPIERVIGKGVLVKEVSEASALYKAGFRPGDGLFEANGKKVKAPADILTEIEKGEVTEIRYYREGHYWQFKVARNDLMSGTTAEEKLGLKSWSKSRSWRSSGFYSHYTTYAEVLQQVASLVFGLLIAGFALIVFRRKKLENEEDSDFSGPGMMPADAGAAEKSFNIGPLSIPYVNVLLAFCVGLMAFVLLLTITRASQAGFLASCLLIVLIGGGRKLIIAGLLLSIPAVLGAVLFLQHTRNVGFLDTNDGSTTWRLTVYGEALDLWTKSPRNFVFGVGLDSIKRYAKEWHLFDDGRLQIGHFHSTPLQLLVERGLPALLFWLWMFGIYLFNLFRSLRKLDFKSWIDKGVVLGAFGGGAGFVVSSLVHFNFGDGEVVMVLYMIMALAVGTTTLTLRKNSEATTDPQE